MMRYDDEGEVHELIMLAVGQAHLAPTVVEAWDEIVGTRYEFRASDRRHVPWHVARARGYAACGEAAAYLAAAAIREGLRAEIAIVTGPPESCGDGYRHAVAVVDGVPLDPYARHACDAPMVPLARGRA